MTTNCISTRRHDLDALRACAMLLGIALHASIAYSTFGWAVIDPSQSHFFNWFFYAIHGFRMQLFFLLSGFFTAMLYQKRGLKALLTHRLKRVCIPLIIFAPLSIPLIEWILKFARIKQEAPPWLATSSHWLESFNLHHLWFLWFLCLFVIAFAITTYLPKPKFSAKWFNSPRCLCWLLPLTLVAQSLLTRAYPSFGPESSLGIIPIPAVVFYYGIFFSFGPLLYYFGDSCLSKYWKRFISLSLLILFPAGVTIEWWSYYHYPLLQWLSDILQVSFSWLMCFGFIGLFRSKLAYISPRFRYLSDASYWLYIAHLPLVFGLQFLLQDWPLSCWIKFPLVTLSSFVGLLLSYHYCVRGRMLGKLLNGK